MLLTQEEELSIPPKPVLRPIDDIEVDDFALQLEHMCLEDEDNDPAIIDFKINEKTTLEEETTSEELDQCDRSSPKRRHRDTQQMVIHRRSMLNKLDQLERMYFHINTVQPNAFTTLSDFSVAKQKL